jgi:hypothetical protein
MNDPEPILNPPAGPPALPRLVARVAVTGHRPPAPGTTASTGSQAIVANDAAIRDSIRTVLKAVVANSREIWSSSKGAYSREEPLLRILSSLAEGADRMVAEEALKMTPCHDVSLECPLPAPCELYCKDFKTPRSKVKFKRLAAQADAVFQLAGRLDPGPTRPDYASASQVALNNCDLLITIWDGEYGKPGGTGWTVEQAKRRHLPIVRIDVSNPADITMYKSAEGWVSDWQGELQRVLHLAFQPPHDDASESHPKQRSAVRWLARYAGETTGSGLNEEERAKKLAKHYSDRYRDSYKWRYGLAAIAVLCAVNGLVYGQELPGLWPELWPGTELACIAGIFLSYLLASGGEWHERWLDYRLLVEQFRVLDFLQPLGATVPAFHPPRYWGTAPVLHSCVRWYFRARLRELRLPCAEVTDRYFQAEKARLLKVVLGQLKYHEGKHMSGERRNQFMESAGLVLFALTAVACIFHLIDCGSAILLGAVTAGLPAIGASIEGLHAQEEGRRIAGQSEAMARHLMEVKHRLEKLTSVADFAKLAEIATDLAAEMTWETSGWHNLIMGQPPKL